MHPNCSLSQILLVGAFAANICVAGPMGTFFNEESSRRELFPAYTSIALDTIRFNDSNTAIAKAMLKGPAVDNQATFERVLSKEGVAGYIYRAREMGKVQNMDFAVSLDKEGKVQRVILTAYRESIGGEVKSNRFMKQFQGKTSASPLQLHRDVDGITGATLSSRAITVGVRKAVCYWKLKYGKN